MKPALNPVDDQIVRRGWPDKPILAVCEFATVAILFWADVHHHIFISKTLYLFPLAWFSLSVRGLRWRDVGLGSLSELAHDSADRPRSWSHARSLRTFHLSAAADPHHRKATRPF